MAKAKVWTAGVIIVALGVGGVAGYAVMTDGSRDSMIVDPPAAVAAPASTLLNPAQATTYDGAALTAALDQLASNPALGNFGAQVIDTNTGQVVWQHNADALLRPASVTKLLTATAALSELGAQDVISTPIYVHDDTVYIRAAGDVNITNEQLDAAATAIKNTNPGTLRSIIIDTSIWGQPAWADGWDPDDIAGGFITNMEPAMLYGARIGGTTGDLPRSTTPSLDVATALGQRLGIADVESGTVPQDISATTPTTSINSEPLYKRLREMMLESDNIMAEAIGREVATHRAQKGNETTAIDAVLGTLREKGFNVDGLVLHDVCGLSTADRIPPSVLAGLLARAAENTPAGNQVRELLDVLPVAGATGTLLTRFDDSAGRGWVRAKTGTLDATNALAGVVTGQSGTVFSFALISNENDSAVARPILDQISTTLRTQG
ncbi:MAG: D-alanyl-D-alanine carboxypeptidase/D-alanyl-D-alanine-endopeptidase [Corynebacterium sp.]|nr:D-alanyl-D-alanine carboxypeptidase/D-alanyl-D-alanine-endopeptidase [Corynebacterium sp.]